MPSPNRPSDPDFNTFELRAKHGATDKWRGMRLQGSAAYLRPGEIRRGYNIRPDGDGYRERGGQAKIITVAADDFIDGIFDFTDIGGEPAAGGGPVAQGINSVLRPSGVGFYDQFSAGPFAGYGTAAGYSKTTAVADDVIGPVSPLYGNVGIGTYIYNPAASGAALNTNKQSFAMGNLDGAVASVSKLLMKVQIHWLGGPSIEGGNPRLIMGVRLGGVDVYSPAIPTKHVDGYGTHMETWDCTSSRPGGGTWSPADVNNVECIVQTNKNPNYNSLGPWIAAIFLEVTHL